MTEDTIPSENDALEDHSPLVKRQQVGLKIKALREAAGMTKKDLVHLTRISLRFIDSIEAGEFDQLPGEAFARGFLRNILKALNHPPEPIIVEFNACWQDPAVKDKPKSHLRLNHQNVSFPTKKPGRSILPVFNYFSYKTLALWLCLPLAGVFALWLYLFAGKRPNSHPVELRPVSGEETKRAEADVAKEPSGAKQDPAPASNVTPPPAVAATPAPASAEKTAEPVAPAKPAQTVTSDSTKDIQKTEARETAALPPAVAPVAAVPASEAASANKPAETPVASNFPLLEIEVSAPVKIKHKGTDGKSKIFPYEPGKYSFEIKDRTDFYVFNTSRVKMRFNGRDVDLSGSHGGERKLVFVKGALEDAASDENKTAAKPKAKKAIEEENKTTETI